MKLDEVSTQENSISNNLESWNKANRKKNSGLLDQKVTISQLNQAAGFWILPEIFRRWQKHNIRLTHWKKNNKSIFNMIILENFFNYWSNKTNKQTNWLDGLWNPEVKSHIFLLKMSHTDVGETSSRREFSHRPQPSSPDKRVLRNAGRESISQFIKLGPVT